MTDYARLLRTLADANVEFIVVGGVAATVHGSPRFTQDVDVVYSRSTENLNRLVSALKPLKPYLRGAPPGLPFDWSTATLKAGLNFTLITTAGDLDLLGEITGGGGYDDILPHSEVTWFFDRNMRVLALSWLIRTKRAAHRQKDLEVMAELELLEEEQRKQRG